MTHGVTSAVDLVCSDPSRSSSAASTSSGAPGTSSCGAGTASRRERKEKERKGLERERTEKGRKGKGKGVPVGHASARSTADGHKKACCTVAVRFLMRYKRKKRILNIEYTINIINIHDL